MHNSASHTTAPLTHVTGSPTAHCMSQPGPLHTHGTPAPQRTGHADPSVHSTLHCAAPLSTPSGSAGHATSHAAPFVQRTSQLDEPVHVTAHAAPLHATSVQSLPSLHATSQNDPCWQRGRHVPPAQSMSHAAPRTQSTSCALSAPPLNVRLHAPPLH